MQNFSECVNLSGSYKCDCNEGYEQPFIDLLYCVDINECMGVGKVSCSENVDAQCINLPGDFKCKCPNGYKQQNRTCVDIDECQTQNHKCLGIATCKNLDGSHICQCEEGL